MPKPKRCLLVITGAFMLGGGIAAANRLVIYALNDAGFTIDVLALNEENATDIYNKLGNVRQHGFRNNKIAFTLVVCKTLVSQRYAFVFCDHVNLAFSLALPAKLGLTRYIVRLNGIEVFEPLPNFEGRIGLMSAWHCQAISQFTKDKVLSQFPDLDVRVVDLALNPIHSLQVEQTTNSDVPPLQLPAIDDTIQLLGKRVLLHVGRMSKLEQYKGQDKLIESMPFLLEKYPDVQLVLVGKGDDSERLRNIAKQYSPQVRQAIFMPGYVTDVMLEQLYQQCFAFVMPSRGEGFGLVYLEAMRYSKPCIGSRGDAAENIIQHDHTGLLVDNPAAYQSVADTVLYLLDTPDLAPIMGKTGYQRLCEYYLYPHFRQRFIEHLETILG
jgi:phosphatidyl-myo-inositol dimannoside synthase